MTIHQGWLLAVTASPERLFSLNHTEASMNIFSPQTPTRFFTAGVLISLGLLVLGITAGRQVMKPKRRRKPSPQLCADLLPGLEQDAPRQDTLIHLRTEHDAPLPAPFQPSTGRNPGPHLLRGIQGSMPPLKLKDHGFWQEKADLGRTPRVTYPPVEPADPDHQETPDQSN